MENRGTGTDTTATVTSVDFRHLHNTVESWRKENLNSNGKNLLNGYNCNRNLRLFKSALLTVFINVLFVILEFGACKINMVDRRDHPPQTILPPLKFE